MTSNSLAARLPGPVSSVALALCLAACSDSSDEPDGARTSALDAPPHIVLVLIDTLRADHTSLYGYDKPTTPEMDALAEKGLVMRRHFANAPWTKPSVASILTGLHPSAHGSRIGQFNPESTNEGPRVELLSDKNYTFVEVLRQAGYRTAAHLSNYNLLSKWGYDQGYDDYEMVERASNDLVLQSDRDSIEYAIKQLDRADGPTFVWSHMMSVHQYMSPGMDEQFLEPGETPIDPEARVAHRVLGYKTLERVVSKYDGSIRYCDSLVGELYRELQEKHPNTILIVTSDHGEEFYDHGGFEHCETLYNELLRVPALIVGPGIPEGAEIDRITDSLDIFPTVLALAGLDVSDIPRMGVPMVQLDGSLGGKDETFAEQHHRSPFIRFALTKSDQKLIEAYRKFPERLGPDRTGKLASSEFYAWAEHGEVENLLEGGEVPDARAFSEMIGEYRRATRAWFDESITEQEFGSVDAADLERLKQLGYGGK